MIVAKTFLFMSLCSWN